MVLVVVFVVVIDSYCLCMEGYVILRCDALRYVLSVVHYDCEFVSM